MNVGIVGSGDVGRALGRGFISRGHDVMIGSREPHSNKLTEWKNANGARAKTGAFAEAAAFGELLVLATRWSGTENAIRLADPKNFGGKTLIDATNPLIFEQNKLPRLALGHTDSGGEQVQRWLPHARVVKAFNIIGNQHMVDPKFPNGPPTMMYCGNDPAAKTTLDEICKTFGFEPLDCGNIEAARELESLCILWVRVGFMTSNWNQVFKLLRK